jgi:hypothetical protein
VARRVVAAACKKCRVGSPSERHEAARAAESAVEREVVPVILLVALAPPKKALRVANHAGAFAKLDKIEEGIRGNSREQRGVRKIHDERRGAVVEDLHLRRAAEARRVEK